MCMKVCVKSAEQSNGVFWVIDDKLYAFPYSGDIYTDGIAKSGNTYNHERLWKDVAPTHCRSLPYDYYPRGRVQISPQGKPIVYMNPNVDSALLPEIKRQFGLRTDPEIHIDNSSHYRCHLDGGYVSQTKSKRKGR